MATDMLDQLQENKVRALEELLDSYQEAVAVSGGEDQAAAIADFMVDEGIGLRQSSLRLWDYNWTLALAGQIADRGQHGVKLRALLERGGRSLVRVATIARSIASSSGREVARLSLFEEQAKAFPLWIEECMARWGLLDRPRKPLDHDRIARSREAFARGECEPVSDILARLEQGGHLAKE